MAAFDHRGLPFRARRCDVTAECRRELLESPDPRNDCSSIVLTESTPGAASQSVLQDLSTGSRIHCGPAGVAFRNSRASGNRGVSGYFRAVTPRLREGETEVRGCFLDSSLNSRMEAGGARLAGRGQAGAADSFAAR